MRFRLTPRSMTLDDFGLSVSVRMSKIAIYDLNLSATGCFYIAVYPNGNNGRQRVKGYFRYFKPVDNQNLEMYSVSQKIPPAVFDHNFSKTVGNFSTNFSQTYHGFLSTLDYKFLFKYLQLWRSYATLSETTHRILYISLELNFEVLNACVSTDDGHFWLYCVN